MITKLDNPAKNSSSSRELKYSNTGSVSKLKNYLVANEEKLSNGDFFFNDKDINLGAEQFYRLIDRNVKGLTNEDQKFYSFTLNPSEKELKHIGNDRYKFKEYVKEAMKENYASVFAEKKGVKTEDLVWAAIIHEKRFYTQQDYDKQKAFLKREPNFQAGEEKPFSMHAHIVVSARNAEQNKSLTVLTRQYRLSRDFSLKSLQRKNEELFQKKFFYEKGRNVYEETQQRLLNEKIKVIQRYNPKIDADKIRGIGKQMNYEAKFDRIVGQVSYLSKQGAEIKNLELFFEKGLHKTQTEYPEIIQQKSFTKWHETDTTRNTMSDSISKLIDEMLNCLPVGPAQDIPAPIDKLKAKKKKKTNKLGFDIS